MFVSPPCTVDRLAQRIESAYRRHRPDLGPELSCSGVWNAAAALLLALHQADPGLPLDPELFVAAQTRPKPIEDPWGTLASADAGRRYGRCIRLLVRQLRREIRDEIRRVQRRMDRGLPLEIILDGELRGLSPLGCYLVALREGRPDLAGRFRASARAQHQSCPLYRQAVANLIAPHDYPVPDQLPGGPPVDAGSRPWREHSSN
jgi:hypothetical protein